VLVQSWFFNDDRFFDFLLKNQRLDSIFGQTYKGEYNYQHPAIIGRPVMQSGILGVRQFHSMNHKQ